MKLKKKLKCKLRQLTVGIIVFFTLSFLTGCMDDIDYQTVEPNSVNELLKISKTLISDNLTSINSDRMTISRSRRSETFPMGEKGTWTIFVYMCGSDLESDNYMASMDIAEMMDSSANDDVRFVVQTGGAKEWYFDIDSNAAERYVIQNGEVWNVWKDEAVDMGESDSLADFLKWGIEKYPAANMGLVFWDHGSGSINGVCFDQLNDDNSLFLKDIDAALYSVYDDMTEPFEFIGFDACLMATVENAAILATHANYMIASEETESGYGWNYTEIGNYLAKYPDCDGEQIGRVICDSFYADSREIGSHEQATLSVVDLSRMDELILAFDAYAEDLYYLTEDSSDFAQVARNISSVDNFGGNTKMSGYTNMVDFAGIVNAGKRYSDNAQQVLEAISNAVVYKRNGLDHKKACGLSVYYPLQVQGSQELSIFKDICLSAYYLGLVDKIAYGMVNKGNISDYSNSYILSEFSNDWSSDSYSSDNGMFTYSLENSSDWDYIDDFSLGNSSDIIFVDEPQFDEQGNYWFSLTEESLWNTDYIEAAVYMITDEADQLIELGYTGDTYQDWEEGIFADNFDGYWFSLMDDQLLVVYLEEECDGYDIYLSPIELNGEFTYLRFAYDYVNLEVKMIDVWDGLDENGAAARAGTSLKRGDVILPMYNIYDVDSGDEYWDYGYDYVYDGDDEMSFTLLPDGDYLYSFCINDIYGNYYITDYVDFTVDGDDIYFDDIS